MIDSRLGFADARPGGTEQEVYGVSLWEYLGWYKVRYEENTGVSDIEQKRIWSVILYKILIFCNHVQGGVLRGSSFFYIRKRIRKQKLHTREFINERLLLLKIKLFCKYVTNARML